MALFENKVDISNEDDSQKAEIQRRINESSQEIGRINNALGIGQVTVKRDGVYRVFNTGESLLIKKGDFKRRKLTNQKIKVR